MKVRKFEDLVIWQEARELVKLIYILTSKPKFKNDFELKNQIRSAVISVMSNIPEGYERDSKNEFSHFLKISKGSFGEVRSLLYVSFDIGYINEEEFKTTYERLEVLSRKIAKLIAYLGSKK